MVHGDRIGRKKIILVGCLIAAVTYFPLFKGLTHFINPALEGYQQLQLPHLPRPLVPADRL